MVYIYMRQVPNLENLVSQKNTILSFAHQKAIDIEQEVVEYARKDLIIDEREEFETFLKSLDDGAYTLLVSSLGVLSTRIDELVKIFNCVLSHDVDLWICDEDILVNAKSSMKVVFPLLEKQRNKPKLDLPMGRPKGSKSSSKFDPYHNQILALLSENKNVSHIARTLNVSRSSLKDYIISRDLKNLAESIGAVVEHLEEKDVDNIIVMCPFEVDALEKEKMKEL